MFAAEIDHVFIALLTICVTLFMFGLFISFALFLSWVSICVFERLIPWWFYFLVCQSSIDLTMVQESLILMYLNMSNFDFVDSKNSTLIHKLQRYSSNSFVVLHFIFRSLMRLGFTF